MKIDFFNSHNKKKKLAHLFVSQLTSKNKYEKFKLIETSYFLNSSDKQLFYRFYQRNIRIYLLFIKLLSKKRETLRCFDYDFDLSLNYLLQSRTIELFHCNMLYKFDIFDLLKIIKNALHYNNDLFIESHYPKNEQPFLYISISHYSFGMCLEISSSFLFSSAFVGSAF